MTAVLIAIAALALAAAALLFVRLRRSRRTERLIRLISHDCPRQYRKADGACCFVAAIFSVDGFGADKKDLKSNDESEDELEALQRLLNRSCREEGGRADSMVWGGRLVYLFKFSPQRADCSALTLNICLAMTETAKSAGHAATCVVSGMATAPDMISFQYDEALATARKRAFLGKSDLVFVCDKQVPDLRHPLDPAAKNMERGLFLSLVNNDFDGAREDLKALMAEVGDGDYVDVNMFKSKLFYSIELSAYLLGFRIGKENMLSDAAPDFLGRVNRCETVEQLTEISLGFIDVMREQFMICVGGGTDYVDKAEAIARERFRDPALSMTSIAENLNVNVSQLSKRFKKEKSINLSELIQVLRMDEAKHLLLDTGASIESVAERSGFGSVKTLYRAFERQEGVTPSAFRKSGGTLMQ